MDAILKSDTLLIQVTNEKAMKLLLDLEELSLIKVLKKNVQSKPNVAEKYAGKLPADIGDELQEHITKSRDAPDRDI